MSNSVVVCLLYFSVVSSALLKYLKFISCSTKIIYFLLFLIGSHVSLKIKVDIYETDNRMSLKRRVAGEHL